VQVVGLPEFEQIVGKSLMGKAIVYLLTILGQATSFFLAIADQPIQPLSYPNE